MDPSDASLADSGIRIHRSTPTEKPEPDAEQIIATFADVARDYRAPLTDEAICQCACREWGPLMVKLVPFGYGPLQDFDSSTIPEALDEARRGKVFLLAISRADMGGLFGAMTVPRPRERWFGLKLTEEKWYTRGDRPPSEFGIDQNVACELRFLCVQFLIRNQAPIVARPRPQIPIDELESRYAAIQSNANEPLQIDSVDVATWPRFLERARNAMRIYGSRVLAMDAPEHSVQRRVRDLAREAWPVFADE
jgi:hypothetical protein